jgi:hypothetical protein
MMSWLHANFNAYMSISRILYFKQRLFLESVAIEDILVLQLIW